MSREQIRQIWDTYRDILLFAVCLFGANLLWKLMIQGDEGTNEVACLGRDVTMPSGLSPGTSHAWCTA